MDDTSQPEYSPPEGTDSDEAPGARTPWWGYSVVNRAMRAEFLASQPRPSKAVQHWQLLQQLLAQAAFKPAYIPGTKILLERGELAASERQLASQLVWSRDMVSRSLAHL